MLFYDRFREKKIYEYDSDDAAGAKNAEKTERRARFFKRN